MTEYPDKWFGGDVPIPFARTLRALDAEASSRSPVLVVIGVLLVLGAIAWSVFARVELTARVPAIDVRSTSQHEIIALVPQAATTDWRPGLGATLGHRNGHDLHMRIAHIAPRTDGMADVVLAADAIDAVARCADDRDGEAGCTLEIELEPVSPARFALRAAGLE